MNKAIIFLLLILIAAFSLGGTFAYADEDKDQNELKLNKALGISGNSRLFEIFGEGKNKTQFRIKDNHNDENSEFKLKGVITVFTPNSSITIGGKAINIDSLEIKIVGKIEVGAYAMVKGEIINDNYYAEKIVVNQRNKKDIENNVQDEITTTSPTPTPTVTVDNDEDENATMTKQLDFGNIINTIQNFLNYLTGIASKI